MVEIHYHLLFGVDDGPRTLEDSLALANASAAEGVTHIVATPHSNHEHRFDLAGNREKLERLNERLEGRLTLGLGCDFHLSYENLEDLRRDQSKYTINGKQYLLVEFSDASIPAVTSEILYDLQLNGLLPIITHPERNPILVQNPRRLADWIRGGCLVQVTAASLTGRFGRRAKAMCFDLIQKNWVHFIASDAHSMGGRPPAMREAYQVLEQEFGRDTAERLCERNPRAAFYGELLELQPEPLAIYEEAQPARRGFLKGIFGR
ncbi:exopolysaccharide biosynthesis protein [Acidobacteria bacterium AB60]|nr:exopolysaccharide biosynthesis protein [Acidobacteria bacterium AB60]